MTDNLFTNLPADLPEELFTTLLEAPNVRIERLGENRMQPLQASGIDEQCRLHHRIVRQRSFQQARVQLKMFCTQQRRLG